MKKLIWMVLMLAAAGNLQAGENKRELETGKLTGVPNAVVLEDGLVGGGPPNADGMRQAAEMGIRTVIDVRDPKEGTREEADQAEAMGLRYVNIPISLESFSAEQADQLHEVLKDPNAKPALLHCASGQRAVAAWALARNRHEGIGKEQALADAREKGLTKPELEAKLQTLLQ
jgi:uncharacterized protein (TIGR01244 family)